MSDANVPEGTPDAPAPAPPAYGGQPGQPSGAPLPPAGPPAYGTPPVYGTPPTYGTAPYGTAPYSSTPYGTAPYGTAPYGTAQPYAYPYAPKTSSLAIVSLVASLAAFVILPVIGSIIAVVTGHMALNELKTSHEGGRGLALAGTIIGWASIGLAILALLAVFAFVVPFAGTGVIRYSA
ncbi:DUF4190 domain-containing protein [Microbacterium ulmi]|uniref:DUF4190 domain-containing protein n=1 Tax=Microbacterium ulmi TaxID=179095 RepID=A0A7Y2LXX9_9MICO|nr:hypothetical protein [Microbacterium ulmi]NNH02866.1 DUF4190 domain-containing protein [Microbacterium ulmi]